MREARSRSSSFPSALASENRAAHPRSVRLLGGPVPRGLASSSRPASLTKPIQFPDGPSRQRAKILLFISKQREAISPALARLHPSSL